MLVEWTFFNAYYWFAAWMSIDLMWMKAGRKKRQKAHCVCVFFSHSLNLDYILYFVTKDEILLWNIDLDGKSLANEKKNRPRLYDIHQKKKELNDWMLQSYILSNQEKREIKKENERDWDKYRREKKYVYFKRVCNFRRFFFWFGFQLRWIGKYLNIDYSLSF